MFWAAVAFSFGVSVGVRAWRPPLWWLIALVAFALAAANFLLKRGWLAKALSLGMWALLGAFLIQIRAQPREENKPDVPPISSFADGRPVILTAHVIKEGYAQESYPGSIRESIDLETEQIASGDKTWPVWVGVRLAIYGKSKNHEPVERPASPPGVDADAAVAAVSALQVFSGRGEAPAAPPTLTYGTRLVMVAKLHPARNYRNPGAFDYEGYLRGNGISVLGSAEAKDIRQLAGFFGSRVELWRTRVHSSIVAKIHQLWPASQASLMDAMVLGEESFLRNSTRTEYQRSGTYHVLVVSGMNLSILAVAIFGRCGRFGSILPSPLSPRLWSRSPMPSWWELGRRCGARR
jgi:competence protein ComEC